MSQANVCFDDFIQYISKGGSLCSLVLRMQAALQQQQREEAESLLAAVCQKKALRRWKGRQGRQAVPGVQLYCFKGCESLANNVSAGV